MVNIISRREQTQPEEALQKKGGACSPQVTAFRRTLHRRVQELEIPVCKKAAYTGARCKNTASVGSNDKLFNLVERVEDGGASRGGGPKSSDASHSIEMLEEVKAAEVHVQHVQMANRFPLR